jgi:hypothetical protein
VAKELVDHVGLRGVEGLGVVADVLGRVEGSEGQAVQELSACQEAAYWLEPPLGLFGDVGGYIFKLGDVVGPEAAVFLHLPQGVEALLVGVLIHKGHQLLVAELPGLLLLFGILHLRNSLMGHRVVNPHLSDRVSPLTVLFVSELRVVTVLNTVSFSQGPLADAVKV